MYKLAVQFLKLMNERPVLSYFRDIRKLSALPKVEKKGNVLRHEDKASYPLSLFNSKVRLGLKTWLSD